MNFTVILPAYDERKGAMQIPHPQLAQTGVGVVRAAGVGAPSSGRGPAQ